MSLKKFYQFLLLSCLIGSLAGFTNPVKPDRNERINWLTLEEAAVKAKTEPRKIMVDVYTDWCSWCKKMDKSTFTDPKVVAYLNKNFYAVKLNAEDKEPLTINGKKYSYNTQFKAHEAAIALLNGQMSYPTTVYLDEKMNIISPVPGYLDARDFKNILTYFGDNFYKKQSYADYAGVTSAKKK